MAAKTTKKREQSHLQLKNLVSSIQLAVLLITEQRRNLLRKKNRLICHPVRTCTVWGYACELFWGLFIYSSVIKSYQNSCYSNKINCKLAVLIDFLMIKDRFVVPFPNKITSANRPGTSRTVQNFSLCPGVLENS